MGNPILYMFAIQGSIPGYPGTFPAGTWAKVDSDTNALLETGVIAVDQSVEPPTNVTFDVSSDSSSDPVYTPPPPPQGIGG